MNVLTTIITNVTKWINDLFNWTGVFVGNYSGLLMIGFVIYLLGKMFNLKLNVNK